MTERCIPDGYINMREFANRKGVPYHVVYSAVHRRELPSIRFGRMNNKKGVFIREDTKVELLKGKRGVTRLICIA